jgi:hypothetical protein
MAASADQHSKDNSNTQILVVRVTGLEVQLLPFKHQVLLLLQLQYALFNRVLYHKPSAPAQPQQEGS